MFDATHTFDSDENVIDVIDQQKNNRVQRKIESKIFDV